jgi:lysophospholipid acyltransferase (LPLAT)-like uncharacterized protein
MSFQRVVSILKVYLGGALAALLIAMISRSVRWRYVKNDGGKFRNAEEEAGLILFWHGRMLMSPRVYWAFRGKRGAPPYMLISQHGDGRLIAFAIRLLGIRSVAGSSSRGGTRAVLEILKLVEQGSDVGFTPDGPRGPLHECKDGVALVAQRTGVPVYPMAYSTERYWQMRSWDRMIIPKPFSRGVAVVGNPIRISSDEDREIARKRIQEALHEVTQQADQYWTA